MDYECIEIKEWFDNECGNVDSEGLSILFDDEDDWDCWMMLWKQQHLGLIYTWFFDFILIVLCVISVPEFD